MLCSMRDWVKREASLQKKQSNHHTTTTTTTTQRVWCIEAFVPILQPQSVVVYKIDLPITASPAPHRSRRGGQGGGAGGGGGVG